MTGNRTAVVAAGTVGLAVAEALAAATRSPSPTNRTAELILDHTPIPLIEWSIRNVGRFDKPLLRAAAAASLIGAHALAATSWPAAALTATAHLAAAGRRGGTPAWGALAAAGGAGSSVLAKRHGDSRPAALAASAALVGLATLAANRRRRRQCGVSTEGSEVFAVDGAESWPGISPLHTPIEQLYVTDTTLDPVIVDARRWTLTITGLVEHTTTLTLDELRALETVTLDAVLGCIHNRLDTSAVGNIRWTGVPLRRLAELAGPSPRATHLRWRSVDGWTASMPLAQALDNGIVAIAMNQRPLTPAHGSPARVFVHGHYGQFAGAKWLTVLEFTTAPTGDYWTRKGWPADAVRMRPQARIDHAAPDSSSTPGGESYVTGVAWAPLGIAHVQISTDDGPWRDAELAIELSPTSWRRWRYLLPALDWGHHTVAARAIDKQGTIQEPHPRPSFPSGVSGYHTITISTR